MHSQEERQRLPLAKSIPSLGCNAALGQDHGVGPAHAPDNILIAFGRQESRRQRALVCGVALRTFISRCCTHRRGAPATQPSSWSSGSTAFMARLSTSRGPKWALSRRRCCSRHAASCRSGLMVLSYL